MNGGCGLGDGKDFLLREKISEKDGFDSDVPIIRSYLKCKAPKDEQMTSMVTNYM